ncbi:MAG TPA: DUF2142 domain-containing protein [Thermodesulfovibrionales bacterium]|nr:DUF2142 domain-containing protein [Thermodesulfovibrionales bacterium]
MLTSETGLSHTMLKKTCLSLTPEKVFLLLGITYGILFLFVVPPFVVPDEPNHFYRAYQMSEGRFVAEKRLPAVLNPDQRAERQRDAREMRSLFMKAEVEAVMKKFYSLKDIGGIGGLLPESLLSTTNAFLRLLHPQNTQDPRDMLLLLTLPLDKNKRTFLHFPNTAVYSPVPYLPQAFGIAIGRISGLSPLALMYLGRISNFLAWLLLMYLSIKCMPIGKWALFLLSLSPVTLCEATSLSADGFTVGIAFLTTSLFVRTAFDGSETRAKVSLIFAASLVLALSKQAYFLMPLLFLLIPLEKIGSWKRYLVTFLLLIILSFSVVMIWTWKADIHEDIYTIYGFLLPDLSAKKQMSFILKQPLEYCRILSKTFMQNGGTYMKSFIGSESELLAVCYFVMLLLAMRSEASERIVISLKQRIVIFAVLCLNVLVVVTLAYIGWTSVGNETISGVQGRYFIPLSPLLAILLYRRKGFFPVNRTLLGLTAAVFSACSLSLTLYAVLKRFYV